MKQEWKFPSTELTLNLIPDTSHAFTSREDFQISSGNGISPAVMDDKVFSG